MENLSRLILGNFLDTVFSGKFTGTFISPVILFLRRTTSNLYKILQHDIDYLIDYGRGKITLKNKATIGKQVCNISKI